MCCWSDVHIPGFCSSGLSWFPHTSPFPFISCLISNSEPQNTGLSSGLIVWTCLCNTISPVSQEAGAALSPMAPPFPWAAPLLGRQGTEGCGSKNPHFVSTCVSPGDAQASLTQVIAKPQVVYLLRTQHPLLWDWPAKVEEKVFLYHKHLKQRSNQTWTQSNKY